MADLYKKYLDALLKGDRAGCSGVVKTLRDLNISTIDLYENYFKKSLYEVGQLWEFNKISVAVEHMATAITEGIMNGLLLEIISPDRKDKKVVVACVEKEDHQVGGKMVADIFEKNGWDSFYLGANTPTRELLEFCEEIQPDIISLSLAVYTNVSSLLNEIKTIQNSISVPIFIGGQAIRNNGFKIAKKFKNVYYFGDLDKLENYLKGEN